MENELPALLILLHMLAAVVQWNYNATTAYMHMREAGKSVSWTDLQRDRTSAWWDTVFKEAVVTEELWETFWTSRSGLINLSDRQLASACGRENEVANKLNSVVKN